MCVCVCRAALAVASCGGVWRGRRACVWACVVGERVWEWVCEVLESCGYGGQNNRNNDDPTPLCMLSELYLTSRVPDLIDQVRSICLLVLEDVFRDLNQEAIEYTCIPSLKGGRHGVIVHAQGLAHEMVGLADELHVTVLDAIVHHLDVVSAAAFADPVTAGLAIRRLGTDGLKDGCQERPIT